MKRLYVVRHAKAEKKSADDTDFSRKLNRTGIREASALAQVLKEQGVATDLMISSAGIRALETCRIFARALDYMGREIQIEECLYHAEDTDLLLLLRKIKNTYNRVMVFGHNPCVTYFTNHLFDEQFLKIPTCGVVGGELSIDQWGMLTPGCGRMTYRKFPL